MQQELSFMDIIAAIATGRSPTAIGIVRVSGEGCFACCDRVFRAANGRPCPASSQNGPSSTARWT